MTNLHRFARQVSLRCCFPAAVAGIGFNEPGHIGVDQAGSPLRGMVGAWCSAKHLTAAAAAAAVDGPRDELRLGIRCRGQQRDAGDRAEEQS